MAYAFDFALLFIATCSAFYCWTLSRRLSALQNLRKGVGQAMINLTKSVNSVETNAERLNREAMAAVSELRIMLAKVDACEEHVDNLLQTMDRQARETWKEYREKTGEATQSLDTAYRALKDAVDEAHKVSRALETKSAHLVAPKPAPQPAPKQQPAPQPVQQTAAPQPRPAVEAAREMSDREVALARALAAKKSAAAADRVAAQKAEGPKDDLADYLAEPSGPLPNADEAVANFARRLREKQGRATGRRNPFAGSARRA